MAEERLKNVTSGTRPREDAERATLAALFREYRVALVRLAWLLTGNRSDAEDIVQGVFLRYARIGETPASPKAYLRTMVLNATRDLHRRSSRSGTAPVVADVASDTREDQEIWEAVQALPEASERSSYCATTTTSRKRR